MVFALGARRTAREFHALQAKRRPYGAERRHADTQREDRVGPDVPSPDSDLAGSDNAYGCLVSEWKLSARDALSGAAQKVLCEIRPVMHELR